MRWGDLEITDPVTAVRARRIELGLTRAECARRYARVMGRAPARRPSRTHWNCLERTGLKTAQPETIKAVAEVLETTAAELMGASEA